MNTTEYAKSELKKYYDLVVGGGCEIELENQSYGNPFDDEIKINVTAGKGKIAGNNPRAVLIGVYKFFYELGCRFVRPGKNGEVLVKRQKSECTVIKNYAPTSRYRAICSEGAISEQNVIDMVEWLPKVGMNSYFTQFIDGHLFFEKWYAHKESTVLKPEPYSVAESVKHTKNVAECIKKCGLIYQAVGHGWTTAPLGYVTYGDARSKDEDIKPEHRELFAEVNGKRGFFNSPGDTHLCYSKQTARDVVTNGIVDYLKKHPEVDVLHFWLADGINNHCECDECKKRLPSEWYVIMLNELDKKLTAEKINAKIVFLIYCDLLFAPQSVKIENPDRFIMMYAPIGRNYFDVLYTNENFEKATSAPSFARNKNRHPQTGGEYLYYLLKWQEVVKCDSFLFDYHLMTFEYGGEPSFTLISRTIYDDMLGLKRAGLNGNVSCQLQRVFLPSSLPNYVMAETLFGTRRSFEQIEEECLSALYGKSFANVRELLHLIEGFYTSNEMCGKAPMNENALPSIENYKQTLISFKNAGYNGENEVERLSFKNLDYFIEQQILFANALIKKAQNQDFSSEVETLKKYIDENELSVQPYEDALFKKDGIKSWLG